MNIICLAFCVDRLCGDPPWFPHPVKLIGKYIAFFEGLTRRFRFRGVGLKIAGGVLTGSTILLAYGTVWGILQLCKEVDFWLFNLVNLVFCWTCLAPRCLQQEALRIERLLAQGQLTLARRQVAYLVGRDTDQLDEAGVVRATVETVAENTSDGVIAPLCYLFIGGAPLAMAYKAINTLDSMVGYKREFYAEFGWLAARSDDLANFIPARITAGCLWLAAWLLKLDHRNCAAIIRRDRRNHSSPNAAYPEAAVAGALGIQLGGTNYYCGQAVVKPTIGAALIPLDRDQIRRATRLMYGASLVALVLFSGIGYWLRGWR